MSDLEQKFRDVVEKVKVEIDAHLSEAAKSIRKAEKLAEEHGVPFYSSVSPLSQEYVPSTFEEKFGELLDAEDDDGDNEVLEGILGFTPDCETEGWQHSAVCN